MTWGLGRPTTLNAAPGPKSSPGWGGYHLGVGRPTTLSGAPGPAAVQTTSQAALHAGRRAHVVGLFCSGMPAGACAMYQLVSRSRGS